MQTEEELKTYADTVRKLRKEINTREIGAAIQNTRRTNKGMMIKLTEHIDIQRHPLIEKINRIIGGEKATKKPKKEKVIIIKDLCETVSEDEITRAIKETFNTEEIKMTLTKPSFFDANRQRGSAIAVLDAMWPTNLYNRKE